MAEFRHCVATFGKSIVSFSNAESASTDMPSTSHWRKTDPQERPTRWTKNGRSREAKLYRAFRQELIRHVGGHPSPAQNALIHRLSWLQVHLALMDERMMLDGVLSDHASRQYLAWANATSRMLQALGLQSPSPKLAASSSTALADHLVARAATVTVGSPQTAS